MLLRIQIKFLAVAEGSLAVAIDFRGPWGFPICAMELAHLHSNQTLLRENTLIRNCNCDFPRESFQKNLSM